MRGVEANYERLNAAHRNDGTVNYDNSNLFCYWLLLSLTGTRHVKVDAVHGVIKMVQIYIHLYV